MTNTDALQNLRENWAYDINAGGAPHPPEKNNARGLALPAWKTSCLRGHRSGLAGQRKKKERKK